MLALEMVGDAIRGVKLELDGLVKLECECNTLELVPRKWIHL